MFVFVSALSLWRSNQMTARLASESQIETARKPERLINDHHARRHSTFLPYPFLVDLPFGNGCLEGGIILFGSLP
jgi:hypothetical protein